MPSLFDFASLGLENLKLPFRLGSDDALIQALTANTPFPATTDGKNVLGQLSFTTPSGNWQMPGVGAQDLSFQASASTTSSFAAYTDAGQVGSECVSTGNENGMPGLTLPSAPAQRFLALDWTMDANAAGSGALMLAPSVSSTFAAAASASSRFTFIRAVDLGLPVRDACVAMLSGWASPGALVKGASLPEGCWIVTEADASLSATLGLKAGYDFNWVKSLNLNDLSGDLGLRIALGLESTLTTTLDGTFRAVVSREPGADSTRLRIFRLRAAQADVALNARADIALSTGTLTPDRLDDFIKAVLGIHDAQLLSFLDRADAQTIVQELGSTFLEKLCDSEAGEPEMHRGFTALQGLLGKWNDLPHTVSSVLWKYASNPAALAGLQQAATTLAAGDADAVHTLLNGMLKDTGFFNVPVCEWLEAASSQTLFSLYEGQASVLQRLAEKVLPVLDGSALQGTLTRLAAQVDSTLNLPALEIALSRQDLSGTARWMLQQLAGFLGVDVSRLQPNLGRLNAAMTTLRTRASDLYEATRKALNGTYGFSLTAAYKASNEASALIDVSFAPGAHAHLAEALLGRFDAILSGSLPGVTLNVGTLTHALMRNAHVAVHLPWWNGAADDLAKASATAHFADGADGRVQVFEASASDLASLVKESSLQRFSTCSVGLSGSAPGVRKYNVQAVNFGFSYLIEMTGMTTQQFTYSFRDAGEAYFPSTFASEAAFSSFVAGLSAASTLPGLSLGTVWANLQVSIRPTGNVDWISRLLNGPAPDFYAMSRSMQTSIRFWLLKAYSADPKRLANISSTQPFLVYAALPSGNGAFYDGSTLTLAKTGTGPIVWDTLDPELVRAMCITYALPGLARITQSIADLLSSVPGLAGSASFYAGQAPQILHAALQWPGSGSTSAPLIRYLQAEKAVIDHTQLAFEGLRKAGGKQLQHALPLFASALLKLVQTLNRNLADLSLDAPQLMQNFAPLVLQGAVQEMFGDALEFELGALLDVALLRGPALPAGSDPPADAEVLVRQRVLTP